MNLLNSYHLWMFIILWLSMTNSLETISQKNQEINQKEAESFYLSVRDKIEKLKPGDRLPVNVIKNLYEATEYNHEKSMEILATLFFLSDGVFQNLPTSKRFFDVLASLGNPRGQFGKFLFDLHGFGIQNKTLSSALTNLHFAALQGDTYAEMALAYRYYFGINVENSCENALSYYSRTAKKVFEELHAKVKELGYLAAGGSGVHRIRLQEEASNSGIGMTTPSSVLIDDEFLNYMKFMADKNNVSAQISLGQLYYQGSHGVLQDHDKALYHFKSAYSTGNVLAGAYIGEIYMHGTSSHGKDEVLGMEYLREAADKQNPIALTGLGLTYMNKDSIKAMEFLNKAADQGWPDAQFYMGLIFLGEMNNENFHAKVDYRIALRYLSLASQQGNILAIYYLALMHSSGTGVLRSCQTATLLFKNVAERGIWSYYFNSAHKLYHAGSVDLAFTQYLLLAEMGYEVAASNLAFLLEEGNVSIIPKEDHLQLALVYWHRSASQDNPDSRIKIGDYYYYGMGTEPDYNLAVQHYRIASDVLHNSQAMFNLGYMHENGLGFKKDLHLAKRYYDIASETSTDALVPTTIALGKLQFIFYMDYLRDQMKQNSLGRMLLAQDPEIIAITVLIMVLLALFLEKFYLGNRNIDGLQRRAPTNQPTSPNNLSLLNTQAQSNQN